jgi:RNA polymerase sigma factor (sigma-70 family)
MISVGAVSAAAASEASLSEDRTTQAPIDDEAADVALAGKGDREAFGRLYRRHVGRIHGLAGRMAGAEAADDLTQEVFVRAWMKLNTFRAESRFGTWLYRVAINVIVECRRRGLNEWRQVDDDRAMRHVPAAPADTPLAVDLAAAVGRLPDGARQVFVLHDVEGYKHHEIGKLVGIATGTSKWQLHRARMILRRHLRGRSAGEAGRQT